MVNVGPPKSKKVISHGIIGLLFISLLVLDFPGPPARRIVPARYEAPLPNGGSIFFVGNSLLGWNGRNLSEWVAALGRAQGLTFEVGGDIVPGDLPLADFLHHPAVAAALASGKYRVWILQGHELEPVDRPMEFRKAVREFNSAVLATGGHIVLFMTWEFRWRKFLSELAEAYESIGQELGIPIIPMGLVYRDCSLSPPVGFTSSFLTASPEHPDGDIHQNEFGTAANTYATYAILTGQNPLGRVFRAPGNTIDPSILRYLSDRAWAAAEPRLMIRDPAPGLATP